VTTWLSARSGPAARSGFPANGVTTTSRRINESVCSSPARKVRDTWLWYRRKESGSCQGTVRRLPMWAQQHAVRAYPVRDRFGAPQLRPEAVGVERYAEPLRDVLRSSRRPTPEPASRNHAVGMTRRWQQSGWLVSLCGSKTDNRCQMSLMGYGGSMTRGASFVG
jgi:hypothetical protein